MKTYAETGKLPWSLRARPGYWIGKGVQDAVRFSELCDIPTDCIIRILRGGRNENEDI